MKPTDDLRWQALESRDKQSDGTFVYGVLTTGVYCRPSCSSRRPRRENVRFFDNRQQAEEAGLRACRKCRPDQSREQSTVARATRYIAEHLDEKLDLATLALAVQVSPFALHRRFKAELAMSPLKYVESCRLEKLKQGLKTGQNVTTSMMDAGYSSTSRLFEQASPKLGMAPRDYAAGGAGLLIRHSTVPTALGPVVLAYTDRGLCCAQFLDSNSEPQDLLKREFPNATLDLDPQAPPELAEIVQALALGKGARTTLQLDLRGTLFQQQVWQELRRIPLGETRSYVDVARAIGRPTASRAVARACATNRLAMIVPCHRVVRGDGDLSGYRWGRDRKRALLEAEQGTGRKRKQAGA